MNKKQPVITVDEWLDAVTTSIAQRPPNGITVNEMALKTGTSQSRCGRILLEAFRNGEMDRVLFKKTGAGSAEYVYIPITTKSNAKNKKAAAKRRAKV